MTRSAIGEFELHVLLSLMRTGADGYGMRVRQEMVRQTGREVSIGAVYVTLQRLQEKGLVDSSVDAPRPVQGGRSRRIYTITLEGKAQVREAMETIRRQAEGLDLGPA